MPGNLTKPSNFLSFLKVWNLYGIGRVCEAVDPALEGQFQEEEASRLLQIGLLCVQASAELRPSMSTVVKMLSDNHDIPQPTHPPFLNSSSAEISQSRPSRTYHSQPESYTHSLGRPSRTYNSQPESYTHSSGNNSTENGIEPRWTLKLLKHFFTLFPCFKFFHSIHSTGFGCCQLEGSLLPGFSIPSFCYLIW